MKITPQEEALYQRYKRNIFLIADGYKCMMDFLNSNFQLSKKDVSLSEKKIASIELNRIKPPDKIVLSAFQINRDNKSEYLFNETPTLFDKNNITILLEKDFGCLICESERLRLELDIRKTLTQNDIDTRSDKLRYLLFCLSELEKFQQ